MGSRRECELCNVPLQTHNRLHRRRRLPRKAGDLSHRRAPCPQGGTALKVLVVTNSPIAVPRDAMIERVVVGAGMDEADPVSAATADKDNTTRRGRASRRAGVAG